MQTLELHYNWYTNLDAYNYKYTKQIAISHTDISGNGYVDESYSGLSYFDLQLETREGFLLIEIQYNGNTTGAAEITYHIANSLGELVEVHILIDFLTTIEAAKADKGELQILNEYFPFLKSGGTIQLNYVAANVFMDESIIVPNCGWLTVAHNGSEYYITGEPNENGDRIGGITIMPYSQYIYVNSYDVEKGEAAGFVLPNVDLEVRQQGGYVPPVVNSYFDVEPKIAYITSHSQTRNFNTVEQNISSVTLSTSVGWISASYSALASEINLYMSVNTWNDRVGYVGVSALAYDGTTYTKRITIKQSAAVVDGDISIDTDLTLLYESGRTMLGFTTTNIAGGISVAPNVDWLTCHITGNTLEVVNTENSANTPRQGEIVLTAATLGGATLYKTIYISQNAAPEYEETPIWRDVIIAFEGDNAEFIEYRILKKGANSPLYQGKLYFFENRAELKINDILENYIEETLDIDNFYDFQDNKGYGTFILQFNEGNDNWVDFKYYRVFNDWSYENDAKSGVISDILSYEIDPRQRFVQTYLDRADEHGTTVSISGGRNYSTRPFEINFNVESSIRSVVIPADKFYNLFVSVGGGDAVEYDITPTCKPYCLYWLNKRGGYNSYLFNDNTVKSDNITNYDYTTNANNNTKEFERKQYLKEYRETWQIKSDYVPQHIGDILAEIAHTPQAWLHILGDDKIIPVNITDTSVQYKTIKTNGKKPISYTFKLENSALKKRLL